MADSNSEEYSLGSPLAHIETCDTHELPIDMICEYCDKFICAKCAKTNHRDHDWNTIPTAATQRRRGLQIFLSEIKEEHLPEIDEKIEKMSQLNKKNEEHCDSEIKRLEKHYDEIMVRLTEIKNRNKQTLKDNLIKKNNRLNNVKSELEKKKRGIVDIMEFMEENNGNMSDYSLIDNHKELKKMLSELEVHMSNCEHSVKFSTGEFNDKLLDSLIGKTWDLDEMGVAQLKSFQYEVNAITALEAFNDYHFYEHTNNAENAQLEAFSEDHCYVYGKNSKYTMKINKEGFKEQRFTIFPKDMCVTDNTYVYFTEDINNTICCLSPSGSVSTVISTDPLVPIGICQSMDGGLLVTLTDNELVPYKLESHSRRLVKHITVTGDVIHEYEYQEDGRTRLFVVPFRITQNSNGEICVVNRLSLTTGNLVIIFLSGNIKSVYHGQNLKKKFTPTDVECDSLCNILVTDTNNKQIHLLSPDGEFLKFLLTGNEINHPFSLSLHKSTMWIGYFEGLVKVFDYQYTFSNMRLRLFEKKVI